LIYLVSLLLSLLTGTLLTLTESTLSRASITELHVSIDVLLFGSDSTGLNSRSSLLNREESSAELDSTGNFGSLRVTLLGLTGLAREDNKLSLVGLQALDVEFKGLVGLVATTVVNSNTNGASFLATDTSFLIKQHVLAFLSFITVLLSLP
jgi:hypothetical protein